MKKFLVSLFMGGSLFASNLGLVSVLEKQSVLDTIYKLSPNLKFYVQAGIIKPKVYKSDDFYVIKLESQNDSQILYLTKDKKYTISGDVIDNKTLSPLLPPASKQLVKNGVSFTFGKGDKEIYLITDPECPFCRKMEKLKGDYLEKNYKVHVILYPLPFHKYARAMSYYILAGKDDEERAKRLREVLQGSNKWKNFKPTPQQKKEFEKELRKGEISVKELGANGTPTIYDKDFNQINWTEIGVKK